MSKRRSLSWGVLAVVLALTFVGCPCARGAVNASPGLRWWLFSNFGASKLCPELLKRGVPLKHATFGQASVGRFFPQHCSTQVDGARRAIVMTVSGTGYANLPVARRVGFSVAMSVSYLPDFRMEEDALYVWGTFSRFVTPPDFRVVGVDNTLVNLATQTPLGSVATVLGNGVVSSEIGRGFTVVRRDDGDDFALGRVEPPAKPPRQFVPGKGRVVLETDVTAVQARARDYLGPFEVSTKGAALFVRTRVQGAPVLFAVVERSVGEAWRRSYEQTQPMGPPPGPVVAEGALASGDTTLSFPVPEGAYYVVLENTTAAPFAPLGVSLPAPEAIASVSYAVEVGER